MPVYTLRPPASSHCLRLPDWLRLGTTRCDEGGDGGKVVTMVGWGSRVSGCGIGQTRIVARRDPARILFPDSTIVWRPAIFSCGLCIQFVQRIMKKFKAPNSGEHMKEVIVSLRKNLVTGSALLKLSDDEWEEIIPAAGLRRCIREQLQKIIEEEKKAALSQLYRRGLPNKAVKE